MKNAGKVWKLYTAPDPRVGEKLCFLKMATFKSPFVIGLGATLPEGFYNPKIGLMLDISFYEATIEQDGAMVKFKATVELAAVPAASTAPAKPPTKLYQLIGELSREGGWIGSADMIEIPEIHP